MAHNPYPSDLSDREWQIIEPFLPTPAPTGRPRTNNLRDIWDALFYMARTGCQWRYLPHDFPPDTTVLRHFRQWRDDGTFELINDALAKEVRKSGGKKRIPLGRDLGFAQRQDHGSWWPEGVRRWQESQRTQASHPS